MAPPSVAVFIVIVAETALDYHENGDDAGRRVAAAVGRAAWSGNVRTCLSRRLDVARRKASLPG